MSLWRLFAFIRVHKTVKKVCFTVFSDVGVDLSQPIATHCNSGMSSCAVAFTAEYLGAKDISVFHVRLFVLLTCMHPFFVWNFFHIFKFYIMYLYFLICFYINELLSV